MARVAQQLIVVHGKRKRWNDSRTVKVRGAGLLVFAQIRGRIVAIAVGMMRVGLHVNFVGLLDEPFRGTQVMHLRFLKVIDQRPVQAGEQAAVEVETSPDKRLVQQFERKVEHVVMHSQGERITSRLHLHTAQSRERIRRICFYLLF